MYHRETTALLPGEAQTASSILLNQFCTLRPHELFCYTTQHPGMRTGMGGYAFWGVMDYTAQSQKRYCAANLDLAYSEF